MYAHVEASRLTGGFGGTFRMAGLSVFGVRGGRRKPDTPQYIAMTRRLKSCETEKKIIGRLDVWEIR
jgi:hypothetical protein